VAPKQALAFGFRRLAFLEGSLTGALGSSSVGPEIFFGLFPDIRCRKVESRCSTRSNACVPRAENVRFSQRSIDAPQFPSPLQTANRFPPPTFLPNPSLLRIGA
jgi:hypothetical protein